MPYFESEFIIFNILIPIIGSGAILSGLFLSLYIYINWGKKLYLSISFIGLFAFIFVLCESLIIIFSFLMENPALGRHFHRIQQLSGTYILFGLPYLLSYFLKLKPTWQFINKIIAVIGLAAAVLITIIAFIKADLFISINNYAAQALGRGEEGFIYGIRDILLGIFIIYCFIITVIDFFINKKEINYSILVFIGLIIATLSAVDDTLAIYFGFHIVFFPSHNFSRLTIGLIAFTILSMAGLSKKFIDQYKNVEKAYKDLNRSEEKLAFLAYYDQLTGLMNRKSFYERFEDSIIQAKRTEEEKMRALLFIDLDNFKYINDTQGHNIGDMILIEVKDRIRNALRESDYLFRFGGDEFTVILNSFKDETDAAIVSQRIIKNISKPFNINNNDFYLGISIGIALFPQDGSEVETLVKNADTALNEAKGEKNIYKYYTKAMETKAIEKVNIINQLRKGISDNEFLLYYQPIFNSAEKIIGAEALIRWEHPENGIISPNKFIPIAEDSMLIIPIGEWVVKKACQDFKKIHKMGYNDIYVSVNLSLKQFREYNLIDKIIAHTKESKFNPEYLHIEITESCLMQELEDSIIKLKSLKDNGINISIDDFGTGYSSLNYLQHLPLNTIKIDKSFIDNITEENKSDPLIEAIIIMASKLNLKVITEGVETEIQLKYIKSLNNNIIIQGYYYSKPLPYDKFIEYLKNRLN